MTATFPLVVMLIHMLLPLRPSGPRCLAAAGPHHELAPALLPVYNKAVTLSRGTWSWQDTCAICWCRPTRVARVQGFLVTRKDRGRAVPLTILTQIQHPDRTLHAPLNCAVAGQVTSGYVTLTNSQIVCFTSRVVHKITIHARCRQPNSQAVMNTPSVACTTNPHALQPSHCHNPVCCKDRSTFPRV